eukprot:1822029-Pleurochrysis_carterae.AAC.1
MSPCLGNDVIGPRPVARKILTELAALHHNSCWDAHRSSCCVLGECVADLSQSMVLPAPKI